MNDSLFAHWLNETHATGVVGLELGRKWATGSSHPPLSPIKSKAFILRSQNLEMHLNVSLHFVNVKGEKESNFKRTLSFWWSSIRVIFHLSSPFTLWTVLFAKGESSIEAGDLHGVLLQGPNMERQSSRLWYDHFLMCFTQPDNKIFYFISWKLLQLCECFHTDTIDHIIYQTFKE